MELIEVQKLLRAEVMTQNIDIGIEVPAIKASDLMSDVLSFCGPGALLITGLTNAQSVRTAHLAELCGIVFVRGKRPSEETIQMAQKKGIPILATDYPMYETCGILYANGIAGNQNKKKSDD